jgi:hypothetical protein
MSLSPPKTHSPIYKGRITHLLYRESKFIYSDREAQSKLISSLRDPEIYARIVETSYLGSDITEIADLVGMDKHVKTSKSSEEKELPRLSRSRTNKVSTKKASKK